MPDWQTIEPWLSNVGGYKYHCFISWPHTKNTEIADCTQRVREAIISRLSLSLVNPQVFLDETGLQVGDQWDLTLRHALCRSVSMVAICAPVYFRLEHYWCGLEWASMRQLGECRLPNLTYTPIIPLMVRKPDPLPWPTTAQITKTAGGYRLDYIINTATTIRGRNTGPGGATKTATFELSGPGADLLVGDAFIGLNCGSPVILPAG